MSALPMSVISDGLKSGRLITLDAAWTPSQLAFTASYPSVPFNPIAELAANLAVNVSKQYVEPDITKTYHQT